jgi:hypothetical protein
VANSNGDEIDEETRRRILEEYLKNPGARARLGQAMAAPIRRSLDCWTDPAAGTVAVWTDRFAPRAARAWS